MNTYTIVATNRTYKSCKTLAALFKYTSDIEQQVAGMSSKKGKSHKKTKKRKQPASSSSDSDVPTTQHEPKKRRVAAVGARVSGISRDQPDTKDRRNAEASQTVGNHATPPQWGLSQKPGQLTRGHQEGAAQSRGHQYMAQPASFILCTNITRHSTSSCR